MAAKKSATSKKTSAKARQPAKSASKTAVSTGRITAAEERADRAEARVKRLERQAAKLKALDKVGVGRQFNGFLSFLREQSVVGLAIGLVLGTQAKVLVDALILNIINPLTGLFLPGEKTLTEITYTLSVGDRHAVFGMGRFGYSLLTFIIVAAVVYFVFKGLKLDRLDKKKED